MKLIGLTGGIACGKSTVSRVLRAEYGVHVVDADAISHRVLAPGTLASRRVRAAFGAAVIGEGGAIDRKRLGALVFEDRALRRKLERIQMPHIALALLSTLLGHFLVGRDVVLLDAALLFETGLHRLCSVVVAVYVDPPVQMARLLARDGAGEADARARIAAQPMSAGVKAQRAHLSLPNNADERALEALLAQLAPTLLHCTWLHRLASGPALLLAAAAWRLGWTAATHGIPLSAWVTPLSVAYAAISLLVVAALLAVFPSDGNVAKGAAYYLLLLAALCVFIPWTWVAVAATLALLGVMASVARPTVLRAGEREIAEAGAAKHVLYAGSFNPLHNGHMEILRQIAEVHASPAKVYACVSFNPSKKYSVGVAERRSLLEAACAADALLADRVESVIVPQYPWRFALRYDVHFMYRGVRSWAKDGWTERALAILNIAGPLLLEGSLPPPTRYVEAKERFCQISSTLVRKVVAENKPISGLVPDAVAAKIAHLYGSVSLASTTMH